MMTVVPAPLQVGKALLPHPCLHGSVRVQPAPKKFQLLPPAPSQNPCHAAHWSAGSFVDAPVHAATARGCTSAAVSAATSACKTSSIDRRGAAS